MKREFTKLMAALALLLFIAPLGMWGQSQTTTVLLSEDFSSVTQGNNTTDSGSQTGWGYNDNFPSPGGTNAVYQAGYAIRLGTSKKTGYILSKSLTVNAGTLTVAFDVKGWTTVEGNIKVTAGSQNKTVTYTATMSGSFESKTATFNISQAGSMTVKLETTSMRAFLDNIVITNTFSDNTPTHTITFDAGSGTCNTPTMSGYEGSTITLPTAVPSQTCVSGGWTFAGWATASVNETTNAPTLLSGNFTINDDVTLYAVYQVIEGDGGETVFNFAEIAEQNGWTNGEAYTSVNIAPITLQAGGGGNNGKYYTSDHSWRLYNGGSVTITSTSSPVTSVESTPSREFSLNSDGSASCSFTASTQFTKITVTYGTSTTTYDSNPLCNERVATPSFNPAAGTYDVPQSVTISCSTEDATILYKTTADGEWQTYEAPIDVNETSTIWAKATKDGLDDSSVAEAEYTIITTNTYTAATSITPGKHYIIVAFHNNPYAMGEQKTNNRGAIDLVSYYNGDSDEFNIPSNAGVYEFVISGNGNEGCYFTIFDINNNGYLYASSSTANQLKVQSTNNANGEWTISLDENDLFIATITAQGSNSHNLMQLNYNNGSPLFACYENNSQDRDLPYLYERADDNDCHIYSATNIISNMTIEGDMNIHAGVVTVKEDAVLTVNGTLTNETAANLVVEEGGQLVTFADVAGTMQKNVIGYGNNIEASNYYLITVPSTINPQNVEDMLNTNGYDLYYFNQSAEDDVDGENVLLEWRNYKDEPFSLEAGTGYLYANKENKTLNLAGTLKKNDNNETFAQDITYVDGFRFSGWNLVGNPFPSNAKVNMAFYKMNSTSDGINGTPMSANSVIAPMEGVFVIASAATTQVTFTATTDAVTTGANRSVMIDVNRDNQFLDRAIVDFNGSTLSKLNLSENATKVYFQQGQEEFAIVAADNEGELPVNFKASRNGRYTMSFDVENLDMNYLHLIDNLTGTDVDLLATPSYSFEANTRDNANRFRLVFKANTGVEENTATETFAYFNGSEWIISNSGNATLQVIDMMGRVLSSQTLSGNANVNINQPAGIYMLRLVNGENVKVQKVVVR